MEKLNEQDNFTGNSTPTHKTLTDLITVEGLESHVLFLKLFRSLIRVSIILLMFMDQSSSPPLLEI